MSQEIIISIIGAVAALTVSIFGAIITFRHNHSLGVFKLKEDRYTAFFEALHNLAENNTDIERKSNYTFHRDKLLIIGSTDVVRAIMLYEEKIRGKDFPEHDEYITNIVKAIRKDLKIKAKNFPTINLTK